MNYPRIKEIILFLLIGGKEIKKVQLMLFFAELSDLIGLSNEIDFINPNINLTTIFIEKGISFFDEELYDEWINYLKNILLKNENYELLKYLDL